MKNYLKILIFTLCLSGGFFGVGILNKAQAACSYETRISSNKYSVQTTETFQVTVTVIRSGDSCSDNTVKINLNSKDSSGIDKGLIIEYAGFYVDRTLGSIAVAKFDVNPTNTSFINFSSPSVITLKAYVASNSGFTGLSQSGYINIAVTGTVQSTGQIGATLNFSPAKSIYNLNDSINVNYKVNNLADIANLGKTVTQLDMKTFVNDKLVGNWKGIDIQKFTKQEVAQTVKITEANGFKNGANAIKVEIWITSTAVKKSDVSINLQAQGLATTSAQGTGVSSGAGGGGTDSAGAETGGAGGAGGGMQSQSASTLYNPITHADTLVELLLKIMRGFLFVVAIWAVVFVVIGGFKLVISQGNEEAVTAAKKTIMWAVLGVVIAMLAFSLIAIIQNLIGIDVQDVKTSHNQINSQIQKL